MIMVNIHEAKAKLSDLIDATTRGEQVLICKRNQPIAELRPVASARTAARDLTPLYPGFEIAPAFFEPLPDEDLDAWEGTRPALHAAARVAERRATDEPSRPARKRR
jgi:prevent-host-death family protein